MKIKPPSLSDLHAVQAQGDVEPVTDLTVAQENEDGEKRRSWRRQVAVAEEETVKL